MPENPLDLTAHELASKIEAGEVSASEAAEVANRRVREVDDEVNAFLTTTPDLALERAERVDAKNGDRRFWEGVPLVVLPSPFRSLMEPLLEYIGQLDQDHPNDYVTIVLPEFVPARWWHHLFHNQRARSSRTSPGS